jgi:glucosamine-6-phosphate deaminase
MNNSKYQLPKDGGLVKDFAPKDIIHRYERMATRVFESEYHGVQYVADMICRMVHNHSENASARDIYEELPPFVLGLTTGKTPLGLYRELVKRHKEGEISFKHVAVFSLDEFYPIRSTEQQSRNFRIHDEFLKHIDIQPENVHIPDGTI